MTRQHQPGIAVAGAALLLAACGSSSTSSGGGGGAAAVQAAFTNYGTQSSAHIKIVATGGSNPGTLDLDVTKDGLSGTGSFGGQTLTIIYAGGHAFEQTSDGTYTQLPDDIAKPFKLFTISTFSSCFSSFLSKGGSSKLDMLTSSSTTTLNGSAAVDYKASDGSGDVIISSGSSPLPLKLSTTDSGSSSSSSSSANPDCDSGDTSSSSSSGGGTTEIVWTYPGKLTTITPPPTAAA